MISIHITGIIMNMIMVFLIVILLFLGIQYKKNTHTCETQQSPFCYTIQCPCDVTAEGPCFGYAKKPGPVAGQWYCSNAPLTLVDNSGKII